MKVNDYRFWKGRIETAPANSRGAFDQFVQDQRPMAQEPRNMADGGRIGFKDGTPVKFDDTRVKIPTGEFVGQRRDKSQIFKIKNNNSGSIKYMTSSAGGGKKKLYNSIEEVKKAKLDFIPDELVKTDSKRIKENIQKVTYKNKKTGKIVTKYKPFIGPDKVTIPGQGANTLKEAQTFVDNYFKENPKQVRVRDPEKDYASKDERRKFEKLKQGRMIKFGAGKGYTVHHMFPLAGKADVTTSDLAKISAKMNTELSQFDKPMNKLVNEAYALDFSKEGSLKRLDEINKELAGYVKQSVKKLGPKYKGLLGFNKLTPVLDTFDKKGNQVFEEVPQGLDFKKSIAGKKGGEPVRNIKTKDIQKMVSEAAKTGKINLEKITQDLGTLGCPKGLPAASGGRIKFDKGGACVLKGKRVLAQGLKTGFKEGSEAVLATAILKGGKSLKDIAKLKNLVGPAALAFLAAEEAGYVGYDMLSKGKSFKEAIGDSAFNYLAGDKTKVDPIKERNKRMIEEGMTPEQMGKIGAMESTFDRINYGNSLLNKIDTIKNNRDLISMNPEDAFNEKALQSSLDKKEDETRTNLREFYRGDTNFGADIEGGVDALTEGLRRNELAQLQSVDNIFQSRKGDKNRAARKRELMLQNPDILNYMGPYPTTLGFAKGGLSGGDTSGRPPESGPMSQGLRSLYKNGRKL